MMDLSRQNGKVFKTNFYATNKHCFLILPKEGFEYSSLDIAAIMMQLSYFIPTNKTAKVKVIASKIIIFEFEKPTRMKVNKCYRGDCEIERMKASDIIKHLDTYDLLKPPEIITI
ncbi:MAG: hypothetical protein [Cressdnaviricota sp.]|nr:MAG: hypothetical protein [Cressdnaviricota sp.]